jgi:mannitol-1-/sugar-/sorbitol-6-phosphatase
VISAGRVTASGMLARARRPPTATVECRAVLLDLDGVLVDSTASVERHWAAFAARHGIELHAIRRAMHGRRSPDTIREVAPHLDAVAEGLRVDRAQAADDRDVRAIPGAAQLLRSLSRARWAVVTSGPRFLAEARLGMAGLPLPDVLISGDAVERGKPDPAAYLLASDRLGVAPRGVSRGRRRTRRRGRWHGGRHARHRGPHPPCRLRAARGNGHGRGPSLPRDRERRPRSDPAARVAAKRGELIARFDSQRHAD